MNYIFHRGTGVRIIRHRFEQESRGQLSGRFDLEHPFLLDKDDFGWGRVISIGTSFNLYLVIDTNFIKGTHAYERRLGNIVIQIPDLRSEIECALILDIGNTRSCGVVIDDLAGSCKMSLLEISSHSSETDGDDYCGVFPSDVCLESFSPPAALIGGFIQKSEFWGRPLSPLRVGHAAWHVMRYASSINEMSIAQYAFTSPKRFFWDEDGSKYPWRAVSILESSFVEPRGPLVDQATNLGLEGQLPPSWLIGAMAAELFEQAEMHLNSLGLEEAARGPRRIRHISITYPPAWSKLERERYREAIERGVYSFCDVRGLRRPTIRVECDEASGALITYVANEVKKFNDDIIGWLASIGAVDRRDNARARVAVIDIGGGTTDLIIADLVASPIGQQGLVDFRIERLFQDGVLTAGDELVRRVAARAVLPIVAKASCEFDQERKDFFSRLITNPTQDRRLVLARIRWAQEIWAPLAILLLKHWEEEKPAAWPSNAKDLEAALLSFARICLRYLVEWNFDRAKFKFPTEDRIVEYVKKIRDPITNAAPNRALIERIAKEVLEDAAMRFAQPIVVSGCDVVLMSGKTSELKSVFDIFVNHIPLPREKIIEFKVYPIARQWTLLRDEARDGALKDVKLLTVFGAAIELCNKQRISLIGRIHNDAILTDSQHFSESESWWGCVSPHAAHPTFRNKDAIFIPGPGSQRAFVNLFARSVFIARRRTDREHSIAQIAYELRIRPEIRGSPVNVRVEIERTTHKDDCRAVSLQLTGRIDGYLQMEGSQLEPIRIEHIELRMHVSQRDEYWIADGDIQESVQW